ncbi:hypothetical protein GLOTRDRAFT_121088 [Gloeophyllum trabeum ATCC 11539]|uniref:F-box domain-containing protein n=1 Tax=Gloeophyllum trabeum (strain ATCC 11539 / FP-39264 / Madison 617) TaxID=670483 RepID=S7RQ78_GLOTA|nr:uncharacterized protein GLOTRDRAFT_121088 [Gloeophyllum trabeum ATCC 11539]EPQ56745.1 hypothetical protein GLOTRDRAFT_121088 [Gloeophyllum trabeum ATCC 11539]
MTRSTDDRVAAGLLTLPGEVFYHIAAFLDLADVIRLRKTCTILCDLTREKSVWFDIIRRQQQYLPMPPGARAQDSLAEYTSSELESIATKAYHIERTWKRPRQTPLKRFTPHFGSFILALELYRDRWLLCVYSEGVVALWDLEKRPEAEMESSASCRACIRLRGNRPWTSSVSCLDADDSGIIVATTRTEGPSTTCIFRIPFTPGDGYPDYDYEEVATIYSSSAQIVRAINPGLHLVAFSHSCYIDVIDWRTQECCSISVRSEDLDELWNGIVGVRFCDAHILCIKTRSVELYPLPPLPISSSAPAPRVPPTTSRAFPNTTFRGVSISRPSPSSPHSISFLAYDVLRGLFHYTISLPSPSPSPSPAGELAVRLAGVHALTSLARSPSVSALAAEISGRNTGRGFVSACALGPEGRRGVWIERTRGSTRRSVVVFSATTPLGCEGEGGEIDGRPVYEVGSYDLRDDLTHCAFSEVTGRIALGTRSGHIQVL